MIWRAILIFGFGFLNTAQATALSFSTLTFPGATWTIPIDINNAGQIVGAYLWYPTPSGAMTGFLRDAQGIFTSVYYFDGVGAVYPTFEAATGINDVAQITGYYITDNFHGYLYSGGTYSLVDFPGAFATMPDGINNSGQIVGSYNVFLSGTSISVGHGFIRDSDGTFHSIDYPGATTTTAEGIDSFGNVVGAYTYGDNHYHGFFRDSLGFYSSFDYPGSTVIQPNDINDLGQIVGGYEDASKVQHAFLRNANGTFQSFDYPGAGGTNATGLNDHGTMVGEYFVQPDQNLLGFLASPTPEPNSLLLAAIGLFLVGGSVMLAAEGQDAILKKWLECR